MADAGDMHDVNFRERAIAFAAGAGAVVLILALLATGVAEKADAGTFRAQQQALNSILLSVIAATVTSVATIRALEPIGRALDLVIDALRTAATGMLDIGFGKAAGVLPQLVTSLDALLRRIRSSIDDIEHVALHDSVTGLPNRLHFRRLVQRQIETGEPGLLLFIDLDRFKAVNDSLGHSAGDTLLGMFAARMQVAISSDRSQTELRESPILARLAGDEFTLLVRGIDDADMASRLADQLLQALEAPFDLGGQPIVVAASIGIARLPYDGSDYDTLMRNADAAMYHAKARGRNQHCAYSAELNRQVRDRLRVEGELREALAARRFELFFQPQVHAGTGEIMSAEALLRWHHIDGSLRLPGSFIDLAEESGLIVEIGRWVIEEATRTAARWESCGLPFRVGFNVSPRQIAMPDFTAHLRQCLETSGASPNQLELEITESLFMSNDAATIGKVEELRALGLSVAIDDFGTGYSNLARLKKLPIDRLKIDRSLVQDIAFSADARTIVNAIVSLGNGLGYHCVAEGVETPLQADILGVIGCELLQGYSFARPMRETDFLAWADQRSVLARVA